LDSEDCEFAGLESDGFEGVDCATAAEVESIKTRQKNLFMLDLSIGKGFPETIAIGCKNRRGRDIFILRWSCRTLAKNRVQDEPIAHTGRTGTRGFCQVL
jgi:hypothetical protein